MVEFSLETEAEEAIDEPPPLGAEEEFCLDDKPDLGNNSGLEEYLRKPELAEYYLKKEEPSEFPSYELELLAISDLETEPYQSAAYLSNEENKDVYNTTPLSEEVSYRDELDYLAYNLQYSIDQTPNIEAQTLWGITEEMSDDIQKSTVLYAREREEKQIKAETGLYFLTTIRQFVSSTVL